MCNRHLNLFTALSIYAVIISVQGCTAVTVPTPNQDKPPIITITAYSVGGSDFDIEHQQFTSPCGSPLSCQSYVSGGNQLQFIARATNPGGVQSLQITISQRGSTLFTAGTTQDRSANNQALNALTIMGDKGLGGSALLANIDDMASAIMISATASNFNAMSTTMDVTYAPLGLLEADLQTTSDNITPGQTATLTWSTSFASSVEITNLANNLNSSGSANVSPTTSTTYSLIARNFIYKLCYDAHKLPCRGAEQIVKEVTITTKVNTPTPPPPKLKTMGVALQGQPVGPYGGYRPYVYSFFGRIYLHQIELPTDSGNFWIAAIKLIKKGYSTNDCDNPNAYVLLASGQHTTPEQIQAIYGAQVAVLSLGGSIVACVSPKPGQPTTDSVGIILSYTD